MSAPDRRRLVERTHDRLSVRQQCDLVGVARSGIYRPPPPADPDDLALIRRIDELYMAWPFLGSRRIAAMLRLEGRRVNCKQVQRLMRRIGIAALGPKPRTSTRAPGHEIHPYLLRDMEALARFGKPEIFNTDQGSQFTSAAFTGMLAAAGIRISLEGAAGGWTTCSSSGCGAR